MWSLLNAATKILRTRLALTNRVDVCVLDQNIAESPSNLNEHPGKIFCYFGQRPSGLPFLLAFARQDEDEDISHIFGFYTNTKFHIIQKPERKRFENRLQKGARLGLEIKLGVVITTVDVPQSCYLSVLIQMAEFLLDDDLINNFVAEKKITRCQFSSMVCFNPTIPFPSCRLMEIDSDARKIWDFIKERRFTVVEYDFNNPPARVNPTFEVMKIYYHGHIVYGIRYRSYNIMMLMLTHPSMFQCQEDADDVTAAIHQVLISSRIGVDHIGATRVFCGADTQCNSTSVMKAILLALSMPLLIVKQCDIDLIFPEEDQDLDSTVEEVLGTQSSIHEPGPSIPYPANWSDDEEILPNLQPLEYPQGTGEEVESITISLDIDAETCEPIVASASPPVVDDDDETIVVTCSQVSSQRTIILSQRDINNQLSEIRQNRDIKLALKEDHPTIDILPMDDPRNRVMNDQRVFKRQLSHIVTNFGLPASLLLIPGPSDLVRSLEDALSRDSRLLIAAVQTPVGLVLVIVDKQTEEWGLLNPHIDTQRTHEVFDRLKNLMQSNSSYFRSFGARQLDIPCHFHQRYKLMHLLLSVFCICQAFNIAKMLPLRVAYTEKRLRKFCHLVCRELQEKNQAYNVEHGLIRDNNFLMPGAYKSLPSPLVFEKSVVATDRCIFCNGRYHKNQGSHMAMAHGGQARAKSNRRRWLDSAKP